MNFRRGRAVPPDNSLAPLRGRRSRAPAAIRGRRAERVREPSGIVEALEHALVRHLAVGLDARRRLLGARDPRHGSVAIGFRMKLRAADAGRKLEHASRPVPLDSPSRLSRRPKLSAQGAEPPFVEVHRFPVAVLPREEPIADGAEEGGSHAEGSGVNGLHTELPHGALGHRRDAEVGDRDLERSGRPRAHRGARCRWRSVSSTTLSRKPR